MSAPFAGPPALPFDTLRTGPPPPAPDIHAALAHLDRPRKHYQWYYSTRQANADMWHCPQGVHDFLRAYYHHKSADWRQNRPFRLQAGPPRNWRRCRPTTSWIWHEDMPATVAHEMPSPARSPPAAGCRMTNCASTAANINAPASRAG